MSAARLGPDEARDELYDIMQRDISFEEKAQLALELGESYLGVENGHLTRIDERIDFWEAIASSDPPDGDFPKGEVLDLQTTYCRRTIEKGSSIALNDAPNQGWGDDPAFEKHGLHCYHGTPLMAGDDIVGTVCFVAEQPREEPFTEAETLFAELTARMLENEFRHTQQEAELNLQSNLIGVLSRVLRHNLRNDLNVIRGQLKMMADRSDEPLLQNEMAVKKIDKLVDLANTARQIESIASSDLDQQPVELGTLIDHVIENVERNYPNAAFAIEGPDEIYLEAIPSLRTALEELVENAAKHAGESPKVTIQLESTPETVNLHVIDNGPGLPQQEREVLREGAESPLIHGSGLGLWLTYWIISNHDGSIRSEVNDEGTSITVTLPRTSSLSEFADSESLLGRFHREQDKFEAVFEESFDAMVIIDDDGRYTDVNESAAELFGLSEKELQGRSFTEFLPDEFDADAAWAAFMDTERERDTFPLVRADGKECTVEYTGVTDIVPGQHLVILRDIDERIERERQLRKTNDRLEAVLAASPDPIIAIDTDGVVQVWNEAAESVFGYGSSEVVGESFRDLDIITPADTQEFEERFERAMAGEHFENLIVNRQTQSGDDLWLSVSTAPLHDESGSVSGLVAVTKDVTDRIERERRFEALSKGFPDLCFVLDEGGQYRDVLSSPTSENILRGNPKDLVGQSVSDVLPAEQAQLLLEQIERTIETREPQQFRFELTVPAGPRMFEARTHPLTNFTGENELVSIVVRDITDLSGSRERATAT